MRMRTKGFTVIEILVALVITGILAAMAVPAMHTMITNARMRSVAADIQADALFARAESIKRNVPIQLRIDTGKYDVFDITDPANLPGSPPSKILRSRSFEATATVQSGGSVTFIPNGRLINGGTVRFDVGPKSGANGDSPQLGGGIQIPSSGQPPPDSLCPADLTCPAVEISPGGSVRLFVPTSSSSSLL